MSKEDNGGPAFPPVHDPKTHPSGLTQRNYIATAIFPAIFAECAKDFNHSGWPEDWRMGVALDCYKMADTMMEASKK